MKMSAMIYLCGRSPCITFALSSTILLPRQRCGQDEEPIILRLGTQIRHPVDIAGCFLHSPV
jgi:hypothetical protein